MDEKRKNVRWKVALPVRYIGLNKHTESAARTQDLSLRGARLAMVEKHRPGDKLEMMVDLPGPGSSHVCIDADVVWQKAVCELNEECNYYTGVIFRKISDCHKKELATYVYDNHLEEFKQHWWDGIK